MISTKQSALFTTIDSYIEQHYLDFKNFHPGLSVDCVIFGYGGQKLKVLILNSKIDNLKNLPGGFITKDEDLDQSAHNVLFHHTGLQNLFLQQCHTFGNKDRPSAWNVSSENKASLYEYFKEKRPEFAKWVGQRFMTTAYFALVDINKVKLTPDILSTSCEWVNVDNMPELILDHNKIVAKCLEQIKIQLSYLPVSKALLPRTFTIQDLQKLYEAILGYTLVRSNFQRKFLKLDILIRLEKKMTGAANKAPYLYMFDDEKYNALVEKGIGIF